MHDRDCRAGIGGLPERLIIKSKDDHQARVLLWGGARVTYQWVDFDRAFISERYDRLARLIKLFEWVLFLPPSLRRKAVEALQLSAGDRVLEIGCGTGRNFAHLHRAVGPTGRIYGVDLSPGMLGKAQELKAKRGWDNIALTRSDAADYVAPEPLDGVLFSLSYATMPHHLQVLEHAWKQLGSGGRLIIMDAKPPPGRGGEIVLPFSAWLMRRTMLGNPYLRPWDDLARFTPRFEMKEFLFGSYYVCCAIKP